MEDVSVMFTLPADTLSALRARAKSEGTSAGALLRGALQRDLDLRRKERAEGKADPAFVGAIRTLLARDIVEARNWADLQARLGARGYDLRMEEGRLSLHARDSGEQIVDANEIGASYGALMRRFHGPLPVRKTG